MKSGLNRKWLVCRTCLQQPKAEEMQPIYGKEAGIDLTNMIVECGGVPIEQFDHYPDKICERCLKNLKAAYKFRLTCQRSHKHLSQTLAPVELRIEDVCDDDITSCVTTENGHEVKETTTDGLMIKLEQEQIVHVKEEYTIQEVEENDFVENYGYTKELEENGASPLAERIFESESFADSQEDDEYLKLEDEYLPPGTRKSVRSQSAMKKATVKPSARTKATKRKCPDPTKSNPKDTLYSCDFCDKKYPTRQKLTGHVKVHNAKKPFKCEICGYCFVQIQHLDRHMNTHTGNRPYKCSYCTAAFADLSTRNKHHRIHTNERPYVCDVCGKAYSYTNSLKLHKLVHTREKPYVCDICGKGFQQNFKLHSHKKTHKKNGINVDMAQIENSIQQQDGHVEGADYQLMEMSIKVEKIETE